MSAKGFLKCSCAQCGGHIEFPADGLGQTIDCPHCARPTELALALPAAATAGSSRSFKWIVAGLVILAVGVAGVGGAMFMAQRLAKKSRSAESPARAVSLKQNPGGRDASSSGASTSQAFDGFSVSDVKIEGALGSSLVYAVGTIKNETDKTRFGVTVELGLFDAANQRLGSARDYKDMIEPRGQWSFRALLVHKTVASARVSSVREQP